MASLWSRARPCSFERPGMERPTIPADGLLLINGVPGTQIAVTIVRILKADDEFMNGFGTQSCQLTHIINACGHQQLGVPLPQHRDADCHFRLRLQFTNAIRCHMVSGIAQCLLQFGSGSCNQIVDGHQLNSLQRIQLAEFQTGQIADRVIRFQIEQPVCILITNRPIITVQAIFLIVVGVVFVGKRRNGF